MSHNSKYSVAKKSKSGSTILMLIVVVFAVVFLFFIFRPKYKDVTIEAGSKSVDVNKFVVASSYKSKTKLITDISKLDLDKVGSYNIVLAYDGKEETVKLNIEDTTSPEVEFQNVGKLVGYEINPEDFVKSVKDYSSYEVTAIKIPEIDENKYATYDVKIRVEDEYGNKTEKTVQLTIKRDNNGPVFSGIKTLTVEKHANVNFKKGITAVDAYDGSVAFNVDTSKVNLDAAGTYYATYTSTDSEVNTTTIKRKIIVNHDEDDTDKLFTEFYNEYLKGKSARDITIAIRDRILYDHSYGGDDPIWYALNERAGNCVVHAQMLKKAFDKAGLKNMIIHTIDKTHYWNLVYQDGVWRHYDSTPGAHYIGPVTDYEKYNSSAMHGRNWDRDDYPEAN